MVLKDLKKTSLSETFAKVVVISHSLDFISEIFDMFGFISKFKKDVISGFDSVQQRLVTLEAKVEALFHHVNTTTSDVAPVQVAQAVEQEAQPTPAAEETNNAA